MRFSEKFLCSSALALVSVTVAGSAHAQSTSGDNGDQDVIVVTAAKRETQLQSTPIAITALGGSALEARHIVTTNDLAMFVPGANFSTNGGATSITIRGVGSDGLSQPKDDPSVAAHLDGVYLPRPASLGATLYDIERIEVLRGPQGTLYGRNATGGAVNIITRQPSDNVEAAADLSYGNYEAVQARAMVNVPLADTFKVRGSIVFDKHNGYSPRLTPFKNGDDADSVGGRITALWTPSDNLKVTVRANLFQAGGAGQTRNVIDSTSLATVRDANGTLYGSTTGGIIVNRCALTAYPQACTDPRAIATVYPDKQRIVSDTYSATIDWMISDAFKLKTISGYTWFVQDRKSSSRPFQPLNFNATFDFRTTSKAFSQEVDLNYDGGGPLTAVLGGFYLHDVGVNLYSSIAANPNFVADVAVDSFSTTNSKAVFGEANYEVVKGFKLTGGIRYTHDDKDAHSQTRVRVPGVGTLPNFDLLPTRLSFSSTDFKIGFDWQLNSNVFAYGNYSTAFKSGGINSGQPVNLTYKPEKLKAWQGGIRTTWLEGALRLNFDAYHYDYQNPQITQTFGTSLETQNIPGGAKVDGIEITLDARPVKGLNIGAQYSHAKSKYGAGKISDIIDITSRGQNVFGLIDITGHSLRFTPEDSLGVNASYTLPLTDSMDLTARADYYWQGDSWARAQALQIDKIAAYSLVNASLRLNIDNDHYYVEVFGRNLGDKTIVSARFVNPLHLVEYRPPRTYGVTVGFKYR